MRIKLEDAEAWYRGDEDQNLSAHQAATFYRGEMVALLDITIASDEKIKKADAVLEAIEWAATRGKPVQGNMDKIGRMAHDARVALSLLAPQPQAATKDKEK